MSEVVGSQVAATAVVQRSVRVEQIRILYRNAPAGLLINLVNGLIVAVALWRHIPPAIVSTWITTVLGVALLRGVLVWNYDRDQDSALSAQKAAVHFCIGAGLAGATWGAIGLIGAWYLELPHLVFIAFVVGGMAIGALATSGVFMPAFVSFLLPAAIPLDIGLLVAVDRVHASMGILGAVFVAALYVLGRELNQNITTALRLSLERADLIARLRAVNSDLRQRNRELAEEVRERQSAECKLRERESTYRAMFEKNQAVKLLIEPETGAIVDANPAASAFYGYGLPTLREKNITEINTLPREDLFAAMRRATRERQGRFLFCHRLASGEIRHVEVSSGPVELEGRTLLFSIVHDITERKLAEAALIKARQDLETKVRERTEALMQANARLSQEVRERQRTEQALRENEQRYALATAAAKVGVWDWNIRTNAFFLDPNLKALLGYQDSDIPNDLACWAEHIHPDERQAAMDIAHAHLEGRGREYVYEHRMRHKDGSYRWILARGSVVRDGAGGALRMVGTDVDITERKQVEDALRVSEERFRDFAEAAADWFWETDAELTVTYLSERYEEVMGVRLAQALGMPSENLFVNRTADPAHWRWFAKRLRTRRPFQNFELSWVCPDGTRKALRLSGTPVFDGHGNFQGYRGAGRDITDAHRMALQLAHEATHDALTGLLNRREFERRLQRVLATSQREGTEHSLCYMDLDQFKVINDTCGHVAGDELLRQVTELLLHSIRKRDTLARLGGDEFGVLMEHCSVEQSTRVAEMMRSAIADFRFLWEGKSFAVGVSIGLVPICETSDHSGGILRAADTACYIAKEKGRNRIHLYRQDDEELARRHGEMKWFLRIPRALEQNRFSFDFQPIIPVVEGAGGGQHFELLLRLRDEGGAIAFPRDFLPAAERYNLVTKIDRWVVQAALGYLSGCADRPNDQSLFAVNLSGQSLGEEGFLDFVVERLRRTKVAPRALCFEVTETAAIANLTHARRFITTLKAHGCQFALDDFGSGLSSFAYLRNLPVDFLKIDGIFVKGVVDNSIDRAMVSAIKDIARVMGKKTIAEFVESKAILGKLREIGVDYAQGYAVGRPRPFRGRGSC